MEVTILNWCNSSFLSVMGEWALFLLWKSGLRFCRGTWSAQKKDSTLRAAGMIPWQYQLSSNSFLPLINHCVLYKCTKTTYLLQQVGIYCELQSEIHKALQFLINWNLRKGFSCKVWKCALWVSRTPKRLPKALHCLSFNRIKIIQPLSRTFFFFKSGPTACPTVKYFPLYDAVKFCIKHKNVRDIRNILSFQNAPWYSLTTPVC